VTIRSANLHGSERTEVTGIELAIPGKVGRRTIGADFQTSMQADTSIRNLATTPTALRWKLRFVLQTTRPACVEPIILHDIIPLYEPSDHNPNRE
jgi:hypothetical protein